MSVLLNALKTADKKQTENFSANSRSPIVNPLFDAITVTDNSPTNDVRPGAILSQQNARNLFLSKASKLSLPKYLPWSSIVVALLSLLAAAIYGYLKIFQPAAQIRQAPYFAVVKEVPKAQALPLDQKAEIAKGSSSEESATTQSTGASATQPSLRPPEVPPKRNETQAQPVAEDVNSTAEISEPILVEQPIKVTRVATAIDPFTAELESGFLALQQGKLEQAQHVYNKLRLIHPKNSDILLGLAAIAARQNRMDDSAKYYLAVLEIEPKNAVAHSGIINLLGGANFAASESRVKQLIAQQPSGFLYFTLGNLYAGQNLWPAAQEAYFQAHHLEAANPDYVFNLAVSLEHIKQPKLALNYYTKALQLLEKKPGASFDKSNITQRISELSGVE